VTSTDGAHADEMPRTGPRARLFEQPVVVATALCLTLGSFAGLILYLGRGLTFWRDEWFFVQYRVGHSPGTFLSPHAEHLLFTPIVIYKILFKVAGLQASHYWAYRVVAVAFLIADGILLWEYGRRRVGPAAAILPVAVVLFLGPGWMDLIWPFQLAFSGSIAAGIGMLMALERRSLQGDIAACALLTLSISFIGLGLSFAAGAAVEVLLRRDRLRRLWVFAIPVGLWLLWYAKYGRQSSNVGSHNIGAAPSYVYEAVGAVVSATTTVDLSWGKIAAIVLGIGVAVRIARGGWREPRLWSTLAIAFAFWVSLALARADELGGEPTQSRYLYPGAVVLCLVLLEVAKGHRPNNLEFALMLGALGFVLVTNIPKLVQGTRDPRGKSALVRPELGAVELARNVVDPYFDIENYNFGAAPIHAAWYLAAVQRWGSPADTPAQIARRPESTRELVDEVLVAAMRLKPQPVMTAKRAGPPPDVSSSRGVSRAGSCVRLGGSGHPSSVDLTLRAPAIAVTSGDASTRLALRRFADDFAVSLGRVDPHSTVRVAFPPDPAPEPWRLRTTGSGPVTVCSVR
jgi:hypothetical protein